MTGGGTYSSFDPVLWDDQGRPLSPAGAVVAPHALNFASVVQNVGKVYPYRFDEALRDNPQRALAMRRDAFFRSLLQERTAPTLNLEWECEVDHEDDPEHQRFKEAADKSWRDTRDKSNLIGALLERVWYGRAASQVVWGKQSNGSTGVVHHEPVNGDSLQYQWDGTPVVLVSQRTAQKYRELDPAAVIPGTDRGAYGLRLYKPQYRRQFLISQHVREAADYFEGELSGGVHGVGLRSWAYWAEHFRSHTIEALMSFMLSTGVMDLLIFNYPAGNAEAQKRAEANARKVSNKMALVVPRDPKAAWPAVEQVPMNVSGVAALQQLVSGYFERHIERLFVGQSMSAGGGAGGGLEGDGRAEFAKDTKYELLKLDAERTAECLTEDWLVPFRDFNFPGSKVTGRMRPVLADPDADKKVANAQTVVTLGVPIEIEEVRRAAGFRDPRPGKPTIGGTTQQPGQPGGNGLNPALPAGHQPGTTPPPGGRATTPNPALPPGDPAPPNPALPSGTPPVPSAEARPNPVLPAGGPVTSPPSGGGEAVSDEDAADQLAGLIGEMNAALGVRGAGDRDAILEALRAKRDQQPAQYELQRATDGRFGTQAGRHAGPKAVASVRRAGGGPEAGEANDGEGDDPLDGLGEDHAAELSDPASRQAAERVGQSLKEKVYGFLYKVTGPAIDTFMALTDTPEDMQKFGYCPTTTGASSAAESASGGDPVKAACGISTHLALTIGTKVLAFAYVQAKKRLSGEGRLPDQYKKFDESEHPRAEDGRFGGKPGGRAKNDAPAANKKGGSPATAARPDPPPVDHKTLAAVRAKAAAKFRSAPVPTADEVAAAAKGIAEMGATKYRRGFVGNNKDRESRRNKLLAEFGDGETCPCVHCGVSITHGTLEQDKLYTTAQGGRYKISNLVPACAGCNQHRGDKPFAEFVKTLGG